VPDSCCKERSSGCGAQPFESFNPIPPLEEQIHTRGCVQVIALSLREGALPLLLAAALIALVAALLQLVLALCLCCFAGHVRKVKDIKREY